MDRSTAAYAIIALLVLAVAGIAAFKMYYSHGRETRRRRHREAAAYEQRMAARLKSPQP